MYSQKYVFITVSKLSKYPQFCACYITASLDDAKACLLLQCSNNNNSNHKGHAITHVIHTYVYHQNIITAWTA